ncbi:MAG: hypothetical protein WC977_12530 [Anaerovoracaceae bacterium]
MKPTIERLLEVAKERLPKDNYTKLLEELVVTDKSKERTIVSYLANEAAWIETLTEDLLNVYIFPMGMDSFLECFFEVSATLQIMLQTGNAQVIYEQEHGQLVEFAKELTYGFFQTKRDPSISFEEQVEGYVVTQVKKR